MSVSDPDPTGYYNPDIPMYSTHSTYDSHNGKSLVSESLYKLKTQFKEELTGIRIFLFANMLQLSEARD